MFFNPKAALAEIEKQTRAPATFATPATFGGDLACNVAKVAKVAGGDCHFPKTDMRHGFAANGDPKTWTGKIIPLDAWPNLTEWDRHGPNGRLYCGVCQQWVAECLHTGK